MIERVSKNLILFSLCCFSLQSCKKDSISSPEKNPPILSEVSDDYFLSETDPNGIEDRVAYSNDVVRWESMNPFTSGTAETRSGDDYSDIYWLHVADVAPFVLFGQTLSATHIDFLDNKAYISYHKRGDEHLGALEIVDLTDPAKPIVVFQGYLRNADINAIKVAKHSNGTDVNVWIAMSDKNKGATLGEVRMSGTSNYKGFKLVDLSKFIDGGITSSANSVSQSGDYLYISSGKTYGGAFCLNANDLSVEGSVEFENGKYIEANGPAESATKVVSLQTGDQATIRTEDIGNFHFANEYNIGSILHQNVDVISRGKSVLHFVDNNPDEVYITMGMDGLKRFNIHTGAETWSSPTDMITSGNTNGITSDEEFIYVANGADGLTVFTKPELGESPVRVFHWDLNDGTTASANMVETQGEWVFVAKGQGGVKILKRPQPGDYLPIDSYDDLGVPDNLAEDQETCPTLLSDLFTDALPEGVNTINAHPEYFGADVPSSILITEDAELSITFLHEGAGYKNVLGYYYYNADNPPNTIDDIQKLIAFPNASAEGSGGGLFEGNTVELLGNFRANTVIGFFLNSNGWNGSITEGLGGHYTDYQFNQNAHRQSVLMYNAACDATVIGFEDIDISGGDRDFNDAIFQIRSMPENAYDVSSYIQF